MGGYMGLGLQQWIYSRDPQKKMFKKQPLKSFTALPKYSRTFKLQVNRKENKKLNGLITVLFVFCTLLLSVFTIKHFIDYSDKHTQAVINITKKKDLETFSFLVNSGENRLLNNHPLGAYSEFKLAYKVNPESERLNQLLIETLSILCVDNNEFCKELDHTLEFQ
ncbi:hypothetical protein JCM19274_4879 [Algibacter lectus]|uniref:Uncharacterized protein n=1 Tax=Algibacter lectus TaxID=221126 RepID=A0A090WJI8_9FLAO|nr:hypothetical protein [Algibacter lectus]GAL77166.1 hypothetical protein JCM19274_4879 [Algibacter lectus]SFC49300.1 hypothetical protein SAMN04489722_102548 [Algibacter lectus]